MRKFYLTLFSLLPILVFAVTTPSRPAGAVITLGTGSGTIFYDGTGVSLSQINIKAGTYSGITLVNVNGTPSAPVLIINSGGQVISTDGSDAGIDISTCRYWHLTGTGTPGILYGFKATGGGTFSFDAHYGSSDGEIDHLECAGSSYGGLGFRTYPSTGCQWSVTGGNSTPATQAQMNAPAWAIYNMIIHDNYVHDVSGEGMYLGCSHYGNVAANAYDPVNNPLATSGYPCAAGNESPVIGARIYNNIVKNVGYDGIQLSGCVSGCSITQNTIIGFATANTDGQDGGITWNPGSVGTIDRNWIEYTGSGVCMGIMYQGQGDTYITNNVIIGHGSGEVGLALLRNTQPNVAGSTHAKISIYNNSITGFADGYWWYGDNGFGSNTFFANNIVNCTNAYSIGNGNISTLQKTTNFETGNPLFVSATDFHLQAASPCVGKGTPETHDTTDFYGTKRTGCKYDIGCSQVGCNTTVPVIYESFTAAKVNSSVQLKWTVGDTLQVKEYQVQRSINGNDFHNIFIMPAGQTLSYVATDFHPHAGINYYRIDEVDLDGQHHYSKIISIDYSTRVKLFVYPNPVDETLNIEVPAPGEVRITDVTGRITTRFMVISSTQIDISHLASGMYFVKWYNQDDAQITKFYKR